MKNIRIENIWRWLSFAAILLGVACSEIAEDEGEDFGNILDSPGGLVLEEEEHIYGWGRSDCLMCHNLNNIHLENRTGIDIDVEEIQEMTYEEGESVCMSCHGTNGTE